MVSFSVVTLTLLITFLLQPFLLIKSDEDLIRKLCSKTEEPVICRDCLNSDPNSKPADSHALALIAINCAQTDTSKMFHDVFKLYNETPDKTQLKEFLNECSWRTTDAAGNFDAVLRYAAALDHDSAKTVVNENILPQVNYCIKQFDDQAPTLPVPEEVLAGTIAVNQDCKIVLGILNSI
ncbi:uncharacterized protein LOC107409440 [Ziziphus jujuba]|uniref:Uncharacterized protein LOC107409440 n=2 Tax=Ziziphus jujuba TaxID=326968 RepID=A0A6P3Z4C8_ZIZJJ|nr:uncharacterized protein LOC107409440 [Ziziphus jujuba]KAH7512595.1 hypothetical protein FEM48_Zijuj12G0107400 [Ziziphus jujuba var. spinosa]